MAVHKKRVAKVEEKKPEEPTPNVAGAEEEIVVSNVVTETIEKVETIEEIPSGQNESKPMNNPLSDFKEKMKEEELAQSFAATPTGKKNFMWPILFIFIVVILLFMGVFAYRQGVNINIFKINTPTPTPTPTVLPEPTKAVDLTQYEIEVLNGSGVGGEASKQKTVLETAGFTVSSIGNADNSDYTNTIIKAKTEVSKAFLDKLTNVLENNLTVGAVETLSGDSSVPIVVIIGTQK
jgi:hypothetical protein